MPNNVIQFQSHLAPIIKKFIEERRACGYKYLEGALMLRRFDRFLSGKVLIPNELPKSIVLQWLVKQVHESGATHKHRISAVRQLAIFMVKLGYVAYVPPDKLGTKTRSSFSPRILTYAEIQKILQAVDQLRPSPTAPMKHIIMPELFRLLYYCGFRIGELLNLRVQDVDFSQGAITVINGKFGKDRLVPPSIMLMKRLQAYAAHLEDRSPVAYFFPSPSNGPWSHEAIYQLFRKLILQCGISHGGRGKGPRVHDIRHAFCVHAILRWCREGADLNTKLSLLATYLGHQNLTGTQKYLHFTAELFPDLVLRMDSNFGDVIPRRVQK